ncbi:diguanylate cyclase/phosphodiesterase with PAS/PAC sensor(s) [Solimonas aquatica]|uniref:cyclic-guanylate-specific phosphodiesterase n=1 Tax=Solimonas aquatica TaxID=489703 RepID=A0A1H9J392_9GAMM|nr:EAL domain-containing protein [Solimonas aquatica]SEQ81511.1 diguanylate cyclase/phosphodiesterase with PAS/PAC sensor(s) [Solimonas aquatica]
MRPPSSEAKVLPAAPGLMPRLQGAVRGGLHKMQTLLLNLRDTAGAQRAMLSSCAEGIISIDRDGRILSVNRAAERLFGYLASELLGRNVTLLIPERLRPRHARQVADSGPLDAGCLRGAPREVPGLRRDGSEFAMLLSVNAIEGSGGRRFVAVIRDISERQAAELALRDSEERLRIMVDSVADYAIVMLDVHGNVASWNTGAARLHDYQADEALGLPLASFYAPEDVDEGKPQAQLREAIAQDHVEDEGWRLRKDGSHFWANMVMAAIRDTSGRLIGYSVVWRDITERKQYEAHIQHIAQHDALTGLANRKLLDECLAQALRGARAAGRHVAVFMIDVDHFKRINDSLGHPVGDQILLAVSQRLQNELRSNDVVARMGGDEFVAVLRNLREPGEAQRMAARLVASFERPFKVDGHELHLSASIGVSVGPGDGEEVAGLLMTADAAMYKAKAAGRGCYRVFSEDMREEASRKLELETAIRQGLQAGEFCMHYQPQVDLRSGQVHGMEALIRWRHPQRGWVPPTEFISVAEETGLIATLGAWTLKRACRDARRIQDSTGQSLTVSVNVSPRQFLQRDLPEQVQAACREVQLDPRSLMLEITESSLIQDGEEARRILMQLRAQGVRVAIDDFGTGYSSLSHITRFAVDQLKIDRSFVRDVCDDAADAAVAQAIIAMAHSLGIEVVAEGIEREEQLCYLRTHHCDQGQGYHFGAAVSAEEFVAQGLHLPRLLPDPRSAALF